MATAASVLPASPPVTSANPLTQRVPIPCPLRDQIVRVFNPDRKAQEPVEDAEFFALGFGNGGMCHDGRVFDQAFDAAQAFGQCKYAAGGEHFAG